MLERFLPQWAIALGPATYFVIMAGIALTISMILANLHKSA